MKTEIDRLRDLIGEMQEALPKDTLDWLRQIKESDSQRDRVIEIEMLDEEIERAKRNIGRPDAN